MEVFQDYAYYYNSFYQDKNYGLEAAQVSALLQRYGGHVKKILNFGCGTGRHDIEFAKLGYESTGIDMSPLMVKTAYENSYKEKANIDFFVADIRKYIANETYDAVLSLFHVMSYQNTNKDLMATFQSARSALNSNGIFLFDAWYGPGVISDKPCVRVKEIEDQKRKLLRIARPTMMDKENKVVVSYEILVMDKATNETKIINETHNMRYFFRPELELMLRQTGFDLLDNVDCKTLEETNYNSWTSYFIARAV